MVYFPIYAGTRVQLMNGNVGVLVSDATGYYQEVGFENETLQVSHMIDTNNIFAVISSGTPDIVQPPVTPTDPGDQTDPELFALDLSLPSVAGNYIIDNRVSIEQKLGYIANKVGYNLVVMETDATRLRIVFSEFSSVPIIALAALIVAAIIAICIAVGVVSVNWRVVKISDNAVVGQNQVLQGNALITLQGIRSQYLANGLDTSDIDAAITALTGDIAQNNDQQGETSLIGQIVPIAAIALLVMAVSKGGGS
jgi:hypothetical protein